MFKLSSKALLLAGLLTGFTTTAWASPAGPFGASCRAGSAAVQQSAAQCRASDKGGLASGLLLIRDVRAASGGGNGNGCWSACFDDFHECVGIRTKNLCVSRVKVCLETCEKLSDRPGM